jgi:hypothetical protein
MDSTSALDSSPDPSRSQPSQVSAPLAIEHQESKDTKPGDPQTETGQASKSKLNEECVLQRSANNTADDSP